MLHMGRKVERFVIGACRVYQVAAMVAVVSGNVLLCCAAAYYEMLHVISKEKPWKRQP